VLYLKPLEQLAGDDQALDLAGTFADEHEKGVAVVALDVEVGGVAEAVLCPD
jgi:hypothetical protein